MKPNTLSLVLFVLLTYVALSPIVQAVNPPPDGGYPGFNTAEGQNALLSVTSGAGNTGVGWYSLFSDTDGSFNTAIGAGTLLANTGDQNTATGAAALLSNTTGGDNTANGSQSLFSNTTGASNTAIGRQALISNTIGNNNTANGSQALFSNTTGEYNIAVGISAGASLTTGSFNIDIGNGGVAGESNTIRIGREVQTATFIAGIYGTTASGGISVYVNSAGQLGTATSSQRYKEDIHPMDKASEAILGLLPVTFRYKRELDPACIPQFGLVAEQVEKVNPDLVARDEEGKPYTVRYEAVNAMLLNEFLKEHRKVEQQRKDFEAALAQQQKQIEALTAGLQKVSAQLELNKLATQTVNNND